MKKELIERIKTNFPAELLELDQWVLWRIEGRDGKPTKVPYSINGYMAASDNPVTWSSFEAVCNAFFNGNYSGIGFMFSAHDPYCGIDFDKCVTDGVIDSDKLNYINQLDGYSEISQSGTGVHTIVRATLPPGGRKNVKRNIEMYDSGRFFVVTGNHIVESPTTINERQTQVEQFHAEIFPKKETVPVAASATMPVDLDDQSLINRMLNASNGSAIHALWNGNTTAHNGDSSAADLALCNHLAFWTGNDAARIDQLFRQSGLYRPEKWNRNARQGETYGQGTIARAISVTTTTYTNGTSHHNATLPVTISPLPEPSAVYANGNGNGNGNMSHSQEEGGVGVEKPIDIDKMLLHEKSDDEGHAVCTHALYGGKFIHSDSVGWMHYTGTHWSMEGASAAVERAITDTITRRGVLALSTDPVRHAELLKKCVRSHGRVIGTKGQLEAKVETSINDFDADPDFFNCKNGVVNLRTGEIMPHSPEQRFLSCSPIVYKSDADYSHWQKWLTEATSAEYYEYLQTAVGYTITGHTSEEILFYMYGKPRSGKGTFTDAILGIMGEEMGRSVSFSLFTARNDVDSQNFAFAPLQKARFISASESNRTERFNEGKVKAVTGGDRIECCYKGRDHFNYKPKYKIWISSNWPVNADPDDEAVWGRVRVITFPNSHLGSEDKTLKRRMTSVKYLEGVLAWAVAGAKKWYELGSTGLPETTTQVQEKRSHRGEQDLVAMWFEEQFYATWEHEKDYIASSVVYLNYKNWCEATGHKPLNSNNLSEKLKQKFGVENARKSIAGRQERVVTGIKIL